MSNTWKKKNTSEIGGDASRQAGQSFASIPWNTEQLAEEINTSPERFPLHSRKGKLESHKNSLDELLRKKSRGRRSSSKRALEMLIGFLALMLVFTLISRSVYTLTLPQVETTKVVASSIMHKSSLEGMLEANKKIIIPAQLGIMVSSVSVKNGDRVEKDQLLFEYDQESLTERIAQASAAVSKAELSLAEAREEVEKAEQQRQISIARAQDDYEVARETGSQSVAQAKTAMKDAEEAYKEQASNDLYKAYEETKTAYESALVSAEELERTAGRALEDALSVTVTGNSQSESLNIDLDEAKRALSKLTLLQDSSGKVFSSADGIITDLSIAIGSEANGPSAMLVTDSSQGYRLECVATSKQAKYIEVGDEVTVTVSGGEKGFSSTVSGKTESVNQAGSFIISTMVPVDFAVGASTAQLVCSKASSRYPEVLPIGAIVSFSEDGIKKQCVFVLEEENTVLGKQMIVRRVAVDVLEQGDQYAAVEGALSQDQRVISSSDGELNDGDRVREVTS